MMRRHVFRIACFYFAKAPRHSGSASTWVLKASSTLSTNAKELAGGMMPISPPSLRPRCDYPWMKRLFGVIFVWGCVNHGRFRCPRPALYVNGSTFAARGCQAYALARITSIIVPLVRILLFNLNPLTRPMRSRMKAIQYVSGWIGKSSAITITETVQRNANLHFQVIVPS